MNIVVNFQFGSHLATIKKNWLLFWENLYYFRNVLSEIIIATYQFSAVLVAVEKQWANVAVKWFVGVCFSSCTKYG